MTEIRNARTGQTMRFVTRTPELLRIESVNPPHSPLEPGDTLVIPAGVPHQFENDGDEAAVSVQEFRPALRIADFFTEYFELANRGELDANGTPSLLRMSVMAPRFGDEIRVVKPPWPVQRAVFAVLRPLARRRGY